MVGKFDYNNSDVMNILNNPGYTEDQKKALFEKYKSDLKETRRKEIISRLNECAKNNPIITQEEYVNFLKKYNDDDLSKPFEVIEKELDSFSREMQIKYDNYMAEKAAKEAAAKAVVPETPVEQVAPVEPVNNSLADEIKPDVTPVEYNSNELSDTIFNQSPVTETPVVDETIDDLKPTVFEDNEVKEVMPDEIPELNEKGNASAIIISIIAIIIGMVIMYSIIKLK
ncbi:MAG: hypothetical protein J6O56_00220 [Bacilli bacterium]|nr:hypothetical protein [Bacilli bacterium]